MVSAMEDFTYRPGEVVYAAETLFNDGSIPDLAEGELVAEAGARGVVVKSGHVEAMPEVEVFLVRFENAELVLGPPVGCLAEELTQSATQPATQSAEAGGVVITQ